MASFEIFQTAVYEYGRRMRQPFVLKDRYFLWFLGVLTVLAVAHFAYILFFIQRLPTLIILHQNLYFGIDRIGSWFSIFFFPLLEFVIASLNTVLASAMFTTDRMLSYLLMVGGIVVSLTILIAGIIVVRSNV